MILLDLHPGARVAHEDKAYTIKEVIDLKSVLARCESSGITRVLQIEDLLPARETPATQTELALIADKRWRDAHRRFEVIEPLIEASDTTMPAVAARAQETGSGKSSIWRWIQRYRNLGGFMGLVDPEAHTTRGRSLLNKDVEAIIHDSIENHYLSAQQWTAKATFDDIEHKCLNAKLPVPSYAAVNARINAIPQNVQMSRRARKKQARDKFEPRPGHYTEAEHPLDIIQIDHTKLDIIVVDPDEREPIGRPWLTLGIDVSSRCVWGLHISLEDPDAQATGLCIARGILPKEKYLKDLGIEGSWPIWGIPRVIHVDNGRDFRGDMLTRACEKHHIRLQFRPAYRPNYGAHIERYFGTLESELHRLPGTTFSDVEQRGEYDSDTHASLTLRELEIYLVRFIIGTYHIRPHAGLNQQSPLHVYEKLLGGSDDGLASSSATS